MYEPTLHTKYLQKVDMKLKEQKIYKILNEYGDMVIGLNDLTADIPPTVLFYHLADKLSYLLDGSPDIVVTEKGV